MNAYDENPFFFFVDNAQPTFSMEVYPPDLGKIIELSDTGCDARNPLAYTGRRNTPNRPYSAKTNYSEPSTFRNVFDQGEELERNVQYNEESDQTSRRIPARDRTVPRNSRRSRTIERDNEKVNQWERNVADLRSTLLHGQADVRSNSSSLEFLVDPDRTSQTSKTSNIEDNSQRSSLRRETDRKSRKEEMNAHVRNETRGRASNYVKNSNESKSMSGLTKEDMIKGKRIPSEVRSTRADRQKRGEHLGRKDNEKRSNFYEQRSKDRSRDRSRRSIDRAVDKDSLSDETIASSSPARTRKENREKVAKMENPKSVQPPKAPFIRYVNPNKHNADKPRKELNKQAYAQEGRNRVTSQTRSSSRSADFDKAKHRATMAKRYANKAWMKGKQETSKDPKTKHNNDLVNTNVKNVDQTKKNDTSRTKNVSKSAGSSIRKRDDSKMEKDESREINMASSFDDNAEPRKTQTNLEDRTSMNNRSRTGGALLSRLSRQDTDSDPRVTESQSRDNQGGIQRKDVEKLSAILLSSTLKRKGRASCSKLINENDAESRRERNQIDSTEDVVEDVEVNRASAPYDDEDDAITRIPPPISNFSKLTNKNRNLLKSKIPVPVSRLRKELEESNIILENQDYAKYPSREPILRTKSMPRDKVRTSFNDDVIDDSTSTGVTSDSTRDKNQGKDDIRSRFDEWSKKLEETRRRERDVEQRVFEMARAQKEARKKEFEKRGLREPLRRSKDESKDAFDIPVTMFEKNSVRKKPPVLESDNTPDAIDGDYLENDYEKENFSKPYSLRSSMYNRYFATAN